MGLLQKIRETFAGKSTGGTVPAAPEALDLIEKQSQTFPLIATQTWFGQDGMPRPELVASFATMARTFSREVWVYACVNRRAEAVSDVPFKIMRKKADGTEVEVEGKHPLKDLLDRLNPFQGRATFMHATQGHLDLNGNAYWEKARDARTGQVLELYPLRPDRVTIVPDPESYVKEYVFQVNAKKIRIPAADIVHFRRFNPLDDFYGLSIIEASALSIESDQYAIGYNKNFFKNNAKPDGFFTTEQSLKEEELLRLQKMLQQKYGGVKNAHRVGVLSGGLTWQEVGMKQKDAEFIEARKLSREEIAAAFGVPPVLIGIFEFANYANSKEQIRIFWEVTVLPALQLLEDQINESLVPDFGEDLRVRFDLKKIQALQEDEAARWGRIAQMVAGGVISRNEAREAMGLQRDKDPAMDLKTVPFGLVPIGEVSAPPAPTEEEAEKALRKKNAAARKEARWKRFDALLTRQENRLEKDMKAFFKDQEREVLQALDAAVERGALILHEHGNGSGPDPLLKQRIDFERIDFSEIEAEKRLTTIGRRNFEAGVRESGSQWIADVGLGIAFDVQNPRVIEYLEDKVLKFRKNINTTTREAIREQLAAAQAAGDSIDQIADRIRSVYDSATDTRALRIARTEMIGANNYGTMEAMRQSGRVESKQWIATPDGLTRDSHRRVDGEKRALGAPFSNGLQFPGDPAGPPEEVINCRCTFDEDFSE